MIKRFSVTNFKNFRNTCVLDFSRIRDYSFNAHLIKNGLVNKALLYGKNGSGKSNLGFALMDITTHLTDNLRNPSNYLFSLNGDCVSKTMRFRYEFSFDGKDVTYQYEKDERMALVSEEIFVDDALVFSYDYATNRMDNRLPELDHLNRQALLTRNMNNSVVKSIYGFSANLPADSPIRLINEFASGMLWFRSLGSYEFMGSTNIIENVDQYLASDSSILKDFQGFLAECGLVYDLRAVSDVNGKRLYAHFSNQNYPFFSIVSTGTKSLCLFFYWMDKMKERLRFLFLDEYDAFYHLNLSQAILRKVNSDPSFQAILTTHNPYLADNALMRPDCYLNIKNGKIRSFADSTSRVIREGNSLERMVLSDDL
ncbi:MAG: ATP/GTP-binding protein [Candidatus Enteromonas sp.]